MTVDDPEGLVDRKARLDCSVRYRDKRLILADEDAVSYGVSMHDRHILSFLMFHNNMCMHRQEKKRGRCILPTP